MFDSNFACPFWSNSLEIWIFMNASAVIKNYGRKKNITLKFNLIEQKNFRFVIRRIKKKSIFLKHSLPPTRICIFVTITQYLE